MKVIVEDEPLGSLRSGGDPARGRGEIKIVSELLTSKLRRSLTKTDGSFKIVQMNRSKYEDNYMKSFIRHARLRRNLPQ